MEEVKPCPFCGFDKPHEFEEDHWVSLACEHCGASGPAVTQMRDPEDSWNIRPIEDALRAEYSKVWADYDSVCRRNLDLQAEITRLQAENKRMRESTFPVWLEEWLNEP